MVSKSGKRPVKPVDPDPHGEKLLQVNFDVFNDHWYSNKVVFCFFMQKIKKFLLGFLQKIVNHK